jgi:hypothetical protein
MLSPSSGSKVTRQAYIGPEEQGLREASQLEGGNMGTGCGPIRSLWAVYREGAGCALPLQPLKMEAACFC